MILPRGAFLDPAEGAPQPSRTYRIDFDKGRISGMVDGREAVKQAIVKMINTERFAHFIYPDSYGLDRRIGNAGSDMAHAMTDALLYDDRMLEVQDLQMDVSADRAVIRFRVVTIFGEVEVSI